MPTKQVKALIAIACAMHLNAYAQVGQSLEIVTANSMPFKAPPGELEKISAGSDNKGIAGSPHQKDHKKIADFRRSAEIAIGSVTEIGPKEQDKRPPSAVRDISKLKLSFSPRGLSTLHRMIVASPAGMMTDDGWSGVERVVVVPEGGQFKLIELDLAKTGGKFYLANEAINTSINNSPAGAKSFVDDDGNILEEVVWVAAGRFHLLSYMPYTSPTAVLNNKAKRIEAISAISIAQGLAN